MGGNKIPPIVMRFVPVSCTRATRVVVRLHQDIVKITGGERDSSAHQTGLRLGDAKDIAKDFQRRMQIVRKSGYLLSNVVESSPFPRWQQRTAIEVTKDFLNLNGWKFEPEEDDALATLISISRGESDVDTTESWIARNFKQRRKSGDMAKQIQTRSQKEMTRNSRPCSRKHQERQEASR